MRARSSPGRPATISDHGLLLRRTPFGNSSLVVHVLTRDHGRLELIAKGAYRPKSRYAGVLDWFDTLALEWSAPRRGARSELGTLVSGDLATRRRSLTCDLTTYRAAHTEVELVDLATRAGAADGALFALLEQGLDALDGRHRAAAGEEEDRDRAALTTLRLAAFELHLLDALGLAPALVRCAVCGEKAPPVVDTATRDPRAAFSARAGGRLCAAHANEAHAQSVRVGTLPVRIIEAAAELAERPLASVSPGTAPASALTVDDAVRILDFAGRFLDYQLETRPRSHARFLAAPDRNRRQPGRAST